MAKEKADNIIAPKKRRLTDLYVIGEEVSFDDGQDDPIVVWVQKLTPGETQLAVEAARPSKQKITSVKRLPEDDPVKLRYYDELEAEGFETKRDYIDFIIQEKVSEAFISVRERIAAEDEWAKDSYLDGLQEAWNEELYEKWLEDPEDEDASRVYRELKRYSDKVTDEAEAERNELIYEIQDYTLDTLKEKAVNKLIESHGDNALINEFRKNQLFYAVREPDNHKERYFDEISEIDSLPQVILNKLLATFMELNIDSFEGKD